MKSGLSWSLAARTFIAAATLVAVAFVGCSKDNSTPAKSCANAETICNNECVETTTDPKNCGACGTACVNGQVCSAGVCALTCGAGSTDCSGSCVDNKVDPKNCGGCGTACSAGQICVGGSCSAQCPPNQKVCIGDGGLISCVTTNTDRSNCGDCANVCATGKVCSGGACADTCGAGETLCPGGGVPYCSATQTDNANCGACGAPCASGKVCSAGKCNDSCGLGETLCPAGDAGAAYCAATKTDNANCGSCGVVCTSGKKCVSGTCQLECSAGLTMCGNACVDLATDRDNCGSCGATCSGGKPSCYGKTCVTTCVPSGTRQAYNTLNSSSATGCWKGNPCGQDVWNFSSSYGINFQKLNEDFVCGGASSCIANVGIATYSSTTLCQGAWDVYCGLVKVGNINTNGKNCTGTAMTNGCKISFQPVVCSTVRFVATAGSGTLSCCAGTSPDSMIVSVSAW